MTQQKTLLPGATIGVMGGGQLGRMFAIAARRMGYRVHTFSPEENGPAAQFSDRATAANYDDEAAVTDFARAIDVLTFEFENIPARTIEWVSREQLVRPRGEVLLIAQNRLREKEFLSGAGFPVAPFRRIARMADLTNAVEAISRPAILKAAAFGYDGKGQQRIDSATDLDVVWSAREGEECILERMIDFEKEISVIVARGADGETVVFPVCENVHRDHILDLTLAPARIPDRVAEAACELARGVAESLDLVGLLAVEMFLQTNGELIINELAPRPHNSGHWTIEGCVMSQFEQHVRAVCGLPLGATESLRPAAMVNLLGDVWSEGEPDWSAALAEPNVHLHLYGKREPRLRRKMGHLTALAGTIERLRPALDVRVGQLLGIMNTQLIATTSPNERRQAVARAVDLLRAGEVVALPTETVYGLAADALSAEAVVKIFETKKRPRFDPLIVHLSELAWLEKVAVIEEKSRPLIERLIARFWPGPLTIALPRTEMVPSIVTAGLETIAIRMSANELFAEVVSAFGQPLAAPSANRFGRISPTAAGHVMEELSGRIPLIVDGGATEHGIESTVIAVRKGGIEVLRAGPITKEELAEFAEVRIHPGGQTESPGQLASHYRPQTSLMIAEEISKVAVPKGKRYGALLWSDAPFSETFVESRRLSTTGDLREAAANLFRHLRELDHAHLDCIVAEALPKEGLGAAIMDRLRRAAHS